MEVKTKSGSKKSDAIHRVLKRVVRGAGGNSKILDQAMREKFVRDHLGRFILASSKVEIDTSDSALKKCRVLEILLEEEMQRARSPAGRMRLPIGWESSEGTTSPKFAYFTARDFLEKGTSINRHIYLLGYQPLNREDAQYFTGLLKNKIRSLSRFSQKHSDDIPRIGIEDAESLQKSLNEIPKDSRILSFVSWTQDSTRFGTLAMRMP